MKSIKKLFCALWVLVMLTGAAVTTLAAEGSLNPTFTVKYKANIDTLRTSDNGNKKFSIIDTSGKNLPTNDDPLATNKPKTIYLDNNNRIARTQEGIEIYKSATFQYLEAPGINYIDSVSASGEDYILSSVTIFDSTMAKITTVTDNLDQLVFSNNASDKDASDSEIGLGNNYTVELGYEQNQSATTDITNVKFFDYDVTDGDADGDRRVGYTVGKGVNSNIAADTNPGLYFGNNNLYFNDDTQFIKYSSDKADGYYINRAITSAIRTLKHDIWPSSSINQGSYGISQNKLTNEGKLQFNAGIQAPLLFGNELSTGSTSYVDTATGTIGKGTGTNGIYQVPGNHKLTFTKVGPAYRLFSSTVEVSTKNRYTRDNLDNIRNVGGAFSNNFFPLDGITPVNDPAVGAKPHDPKFGNKANPHYFTNQDGSKEGELPPGDDGQAHNCYFGMTFDVKFTLPENYIGPLDYLFFGDDDMWVYLVPLDGDGEPLFGESQKICDIGGIHSAIGQYVNLWDYITGGVDNHSTRSYMLRFFYLERGASGSSCYMEFTIPQVWPIQPRTVYGGLQFDKIVLNDDFGQYSDEDFTFTIDLAGNVKESVNYSCLVYDNNGIKPALVEEKSVIFKGSEKPVVALAHGQYAVINHLPIGTTYTITETTDPRFTQTPLAYEGTITQTEDKDHNISGNTNLHTFQNTFLNGSLTVKKNVISSVDADSNIPFTFTVTLLNGNAPVKGTFGGVTFNEAGKTAFTLKHGESKTISGIPAGYTYKVEESGVTDFTASLSGAEGVIRNNSVVTATATNTRDPGKLSITKTVQSEVDGDLTKDYSFRVKLYKGSTLLSGTYGGYTFVNGEATVTLKRDETKSIEGLPAGYSYEVTENGADLYNVTWANQTGTITSNATATVTAQNTRKTGTLEVKKQLTSEVSADSDKLFTFTVTLKDGNTPVSDTFGGVTFANGETTFTLKGGETKTLTGLPSGYTYSVAEAADSNFNVAWTNQTGAIGVNTTVTATAANTRKTGSLTVTKTVVSDITADLTQNFRFRVTLKDGENPVNDTFSGVTFTNGFATFDLKHGGSKTLTGLPIGYTYLVEEINGNGFAVTSSGTAGTITEYVDENSVVPVAAFLNEKGGLDLSKLVEGDGIRPNDEYTFTVALGDTTINGTYGDMTFTNGVATVSLKAGDIQRASGLPKGVSYTITEADLSKEGLDHITTVDGTKKKIAEGEIPAGTEHAAVVFTNRRNAGSLTVTKHVDGQWIQDATDEVKNAIKDISFTFTVKLSGKGTYTDEASWVESEDIDSNDTNLYGGMNFVNGVATFTLKHGESISAVNLPVGITYTVTEADTRFTESMFINRVGEIDRIPSQSGSDLIAQEKIPANKTDTVTFTNIRNTGDLVVKKIVTGADGETNRDFEFTVTLDEELTGTYGEMLFTKGVASFTLKHGESKTATGLPSDVNYTVTETYPAPAEGDEDGYTVTAQGNTDARPAPLMLLAFDEEIPENPDVSINGTFEDDKIDTVVFTNENPGPAEIPLLVKKLLDDVEPGKLVFTFVLKDEEGIVLQTKTNDAHGAVVFDNLIFETPGLYTFTLEELVDENLKSDIAFDPSIYTIEVVVVRDKQFDTNGGFYSAYVTYKKNGLPYEPTAPAQPPEGTEPDSEAPDVPTDDTLEPDPEKPVEIPYDAPVFMNVTIPPLPPTGDDSSILMWIGVLVISGVILGTQIFNKRRRKN